MTELNFKIPCEIMAGEGDGSNSRHDHDLLDDRLEADITLDVALIAENQSAANRHRWHPAFPSN